MLFLGGSSNPANTTQGDLKGDVEVRDPPKDSISDLAWSSAADFLAVSSWDNAVRVYEIDGQGNSQGKCMYEHQGPVLSVHWSASGTKLVSGGADKAARMIDLQGNPNQAQQVAIHDAPIRSVRMFQAGGNDMLATGSWDKTVKFWDLRSDKPVATVSMQDRVYSMDVRNNSIMVVGCADRYINIFDLSSSNPAAFRTLQSPLKWQTRVVSCFTDASGFAVGSIEGRCAIQYANEKDASKNFSFKCHRQPEGSANSATKVYAVNAISFHPVHGTFSTAGSDGTFHFWDKDAKHRLKGYPEVNGSISATGFNRNGNIFAYAVSYDWSKGYAHNTANYPSRIMMHPIQADECKPRQQAGKR